MERNYRAFFEAVDELIVIGSRNGRIIYSNPAVPRKLGYDPAELREMNVLDLHSKKHRVEAEHIFAEMLGGQRDTCPLPLERKDGALIPVETRIWNGKWNGEDCIFGLCKDLSREQEALQKFDRFFNHNPSPMAVTSLPDRKFVQVNQAFLSVLNFSRDEILGKTSEELGLFPDHEKQRLVAEKLERHGSMRNIELQVMGKDGKIVDGLFSGEMIESQGQKYFLSVMLDVTERKSAERALRESERKFRTFVDFASDWEYWIVSDGSLNYMSPSCEKVTGYPVSAFIENPELLSSIVYPEDQVKWNEYQNDHLESDMSYEMDFRIVHASGDVRWIAHRCQAIFDEDGKFVGRRASNRDITYRVNIEKNLAEQHALISTILENAGEGICMSHNVKEYPFVRFTHWNTMMTEITGYSMDEINRLGWRQAMFPDSELRGDSIPPMKLTLGNHFMEVEEYEITTQKGRQCPVSASTSMVQGHDRVENVLTVIRDMTGQKKAELDRLKVAQQLFFAQKLESFGVMAAGIAHDFNNKLQGIIGYLELIMMQQPISLKIQKGLEIIYKLSLECAELSTQMLIYTGAQLFISKKLNLDDIVSQSVDIVKSMVRREVSVNFKSTHPGLPLIDGDENRIQQLVANLALNAAESYGEVGGTVYLRTGLRECDESYLGSIRWEARAQPGKFVFLKVTDTGCGMDADAIEKIFDPFFTTKFIGRGLGMSAVLGIVRAHHGAIAIESLVGLGTTIRVLFPVPGNDEGALGPNNSELVNSLKPDVTK